MITYCHNICDDPIDIMVNWTLQVGNQVRTLGVSCLQWCHFPENTENSGGNESSIVDDLAVNASEGISETGNL